MPQRGTPRQRCTYHESMTAVYRQTARVTPVSAEGKALLLQGHDPLTPDKPYWFTIGGQIEKGESARLAAVRELREETGISLRESDLVGPIHRGEHTYEFHGTRYHSHSLFFAAPLQEQRVQALGMPGEIIAEAHWWNLNDLEQLPLSSSQLPSIIALAIEIVNS